MSVFYSRILSHAHSMSLFLLCFLIQVSCSKKSSQPVSDDQGQYAYYPMAVGYKWTYGYYNVFDSLLNVDSTEVTGNALIAHEGKQYNTFILEDLFDRNVFVYVSEFETIHFSTDSMYIKSILKVYFEN